MKWWDQMPWFSFSEDQPHVQGAVAARAQEGLEELSHVEGQEGRNMTQMRLFTKWKQTDGYQMG